MFTFYKYRSHYTYYSSLQLIINTNKNEKHRDYSEGRNNIKKNIVEMEHTSS